MRLEPAQRGDELPAPRTIDWMPGWEPRDVCMAVKAYPNPVEDLGEAVCTAGVDREGNWIRVYPVAFRDLPYERRFKKYQWIRGRFKKSSDPRPESHDVDHDSIVCLDVLGTDRGTWARRRELIAPHVLGSVEELQILAQDGIRTMGYVRTQGIPELVIEERDAQWSPKKAGLLAQTLLFGRPKPDLERIPFRFAYKFKCEGTACTGHDMQVLDWEMHEAYRSWRDQYGDEEWREKFIEKFGENFFTRHDVLFNLGNIAKYPNAFCITGLFYPIRP